MTEAERDEEARTAYWCPLCSQKAGRRCRSVVDGHPLKRSHQERLDLVRETT